MASYSERLSEFGVSEEEVDKLIAEVIRYVLFKTHQTSGCPIKREELTQLITKSYRQWGLPTLVIDKAREKLSSIFGYEMKELQRCRPSTNSAHSSQSSVGDAKSYYILSQLPENLYKKYVDNENTAHLTGFTFVVISIVHLAGGKIVEENLWHHLGQMGLSETDENHPVFGNTKHTLEALIQQRYLQKNKVSGPEGNTLYYELAERALDGQMNERIKEYISQMMLENDS